MISNARQALQAMEVEEEEEVWEIRGHLQEWVLIISPKSPPRVSFDFIYIISKVWGHLQEWVLISS